MQWREQTSCAAVQPTNAVMALCKSLGSETCPWLCFTPLNVARAATFGKHGSYEAIPTEGRHPAKTRSRNCSVSASRCFKQSSQSDFVAKSCHCASWPSGNWRHEREARCLHIDCSYKRAGAFRISLQRSRSKSHKLSQAFLKRQLRLAARSCERAA